MRVPMHAPAETAQRSPWSFPDFRRLFIAGGFSSAGSYMQIVAVTWYAYKLTGSAASVGLLSALALGPSIVGSPIGGALADRFEPRRLALVLYLFQGASAAVLAVIDLAGELSIGWLYALVFVGAIPYGLNCPVIALVSVGTLPEECRQIGLAQSSMMFNITRLGGAVIGGFVVHRLGIGTAFALNAASYFLVAVVLTRITVVTKGLQESPNRDDGQSDDELTSGGHSKDVGALSFVRLASVGVGVFFTVVAPVEQLMPTVAQEHGMTASAVGLLIGAIGVGAILANPIIVRTNKSPAHRRRLMAIGFFIAAPGMIELAVTPHNGMAIDLMGALVIGFGWEFVYISGQMTVATEVPEGIRGRMMGLFFVLVTGTTAVGAVLLGLLINTVGITKAFLATSTMAAAAGVALLALGSRVTSPRNEATEPEGITSIQPN